LNGRHVLPHGCGPGAWGGQPPLSQWRVLQTGFGAGLDFLTAWQAWRDDPQRPAMLHFVAIDARPVDAADIRNAAKDTPELQPLADALARQWQGLTPGFHRLAFDAGRVLLTVCVGELQAMLREQAFAADCVLMDGSAARADPSPWALPTLKAVARCCARGTHVAVTAVPALPDGVRRDLAQCGFQIAAGALSGVFAPAWALREARPLAGHTPRHAPPHTQPPPPGRAAVIGAGLAGASAAASLARRGWTVEVLDAADAPAAGASALPAGLLAAHTSPDDNLLSRLSRAGVRMTLQAAHTLLRPGLDWDPCGVLEQRLDDARDLPRLGAAGLPWQQAADGLPAVLPHAQPNAVWHALAAWVRPALLVAAWLGQPGVTWRGGCTVGTVRAAGDGSAAWEVLATDGRLLAHADLVVVAAALDSGALLPAGLCPSLNPVRGQVSWALHGDTPQAPWPAHALNGNGHFIPSVPTPGGPAWLCGSTYVRGDTGTDARDADHGANLQRLQGLAPAIADALAPAFTAGRVQAWAGVRCTSRDRRPLAGELAPGLWLSTAMGSRGLTFALLCAELMAARLHGEPLPLPARQAAALDARR